MKIIRNIVLVSVLLLSEYSNAQTENPSNKWTGKSNFMIGFNHVGGYGKENPIFYLEQHFDYQLNTKISIGGGFGVNLYPSLLATPVFIHGKYHFKIKSVKSYIHQSYGYNIKTFDFAFKSSRYMGSFGVELNLKENLYITSEIGYSFIWDKYGGISLSNYIGVGLKYKIGK